MNKGGGDVTLPEDCFPIDTSVLAPGDIVLTASPGQPVSEIIRALTNSDFSHAILVLDLPYAVESSDYGVVKFRLDRFAVRELRNIAIRRLRPDLRRQLRLKEVLDFAEQTISREYAERDVLTALFARVPRMESGTFFCSQLVCAAYEKGGVPLVNRPPEKVSPGMLAESPLLDNVELRLRHVETHQLPYLPTFLDGPNPQTPVEAEISARQEAFRQVAPVFARYGMVVQDFNDTFKKLINAWDEGKSFVPELDRAFANALTDSGFVSLPQKVAPADADIFFIDFYVRHAIVRGDMPEYQRWKLLEFYAKELPRVKKTNEERDVAVTIYKEAYLKVPLESLRLQLAVTWQVYLASRRMQHAYEHAKRILEITLGIDDGDES